MGFAETAELAVRISLKDNASTGIRGLQKNIGGLSGSLGRVGRGVGQIGTGLARAGLLIGGAAVTGLGAVAKASIDFEDAFQGVVKTVDEADLTSAGLSFDKLRASIRAMATEIPISATELSRIAETAGALGIKAKDIEQFTRTVAILGVTTNVTSDEAAMALGQLQNAIGLTGKDFDNFASALVNLGNKGASTEGKILEVTQRIGAAGVQIGLSKKEIIAWGAALANLPDLPELAGTAGQLFFSGVQRIVATRKGLKDIAKIAGQTGKDAAKNFAKEFHVDPTEALQDFLFGLTKLSSDERLLAIERLFGKRTGLARIINELADSMDRNLVPALRDSDEAWESQTAHVVEFEKRNKTLKNTLQLLKNNVVEAALTIGGDPQDPRSFLGALSTATKKLTEFLRDPKNKADLEKFGMQLGDAINSIDWDKVKEGVLTFKDALKVAIDFTLLLLKALDKLPNEIKGAALGFLALNKLSGGLIGAGVGNVVGGLAETAVRGVGSQLPGVGRVFAQPVYVVNWPGGFGGVGGAAGGRAGGIGGAVGLGIAGAVAAQGAFDLATIMSGFQAVMAARTAPEALAAYRQTAANTALLPPLVRQLIGAQIDETTRIVAQIQSDKAIAEARTSADAILRDEVESNRIATQTGTRELRERLERQRLATDRMRERVEANRIATVQRLDAVKASAVTNTSRLQQTIRNSQPIIKIGVNINGIPTARVSTGTNITRSGTAAGSGPGGLEPV